METETVKQENEQIKTGSRGKWYKGMPSPNPKGARLGQERLGELFSKAFLKDCDKHKGQTLFEYAFQRARNSDRVLSVLLNKFMPDLLKGEGFANSYLTQIFEGLDEGRVKIFRDRIRQALSETNAI